MHKYGKSKQNQQKMQKLIKREGTLLERFVHKAGRRPTGEWWAIQQQTQAIHIARAEPQKITND